MGGFKHSCFMFIIAVLFEKEVIAQDIIINQSNFGNNLTWCTTSSEEHNKCGILSRAIERDIGSFGTEFVKILCKHGGSKDDCMSSLDQGLSDITTLDAGEVFVGGRYHSLVPIMQEIYGSRDNFYYAVAVVKRNSLLDVRTLHDLKGKKACFAGVGTLAGWIIPIYTLMKYGGMEIFDCNNHVKSAINYFGPSCAVNSLIDKYNPIGDNSDKLCQLCMGQAAGEKCTPSDPYFGFEGAFRCLLESGEVAFLKHSTVNELITRGFEFETVRKEQFEILCKDGQRRPVDDYQYCNWGKVPSHAIVTSSAKDSSLRRFYQRFLRRVVELYGQQLHVNNTNVNTYPEQRFKRQSFEYNGNNPDTRYSSHGRPAQYDLQQIEHFNLFESSPRYGRKFNLLVQDSTTDLVSLPESQQTYKELLGHEVLQTILGVRDCPVNRMTLCVTSDPEMEKCVKMKVAMTAQLLKPELSCYRTHSQITCMQAIQRGVADVAVLDAGDVYTAGLMYELVPFMSEVYNLGKPEYYVVAVAKEQDATTELTYLKGKYTCHTGINTAAGWVVPLAFLISNGWIRSYGCNSIRAAAEYFTKSCVPGALSTEYNTGVPYDNMCDLCHGASFRYCRRDASEDYYGYTGAFRCLVEGGGQVAFVKHTTVMENTDGKRKEWWARNMLTGDFELLCPDGTRAQMTDYKRCSLGRVKANAIVARGGYGYNETQINAFVNLFLYAQQFYGYKEIDDFSFSMFSSYPPFSDLIFQDATQQLQVIPPSERYYSTYLGKDFMRAKRIVDCYAGAAHLGNMPLLVVTLVSLVLAVSSL